MKLFKYLLIAIFLVTATSETYAQAKILSGKVTEIFGGQAEPMMGVNVNIVNSQNRSLGGAITDINGVYNVKIPNEKNLTIVFSYIGMKTERIKYTGQEKLNITLKDDSQTMDEVVVKAERLDRNDLGITARQQVSATQKVNMEELVATSPVTSIEDALQGQLGGVDIVLGGGDPGARASIQIRGTSTLNANADPLIVVDGVPYPSDISDDTDFSNMNNDDLGALLNISPQDIESIEVLKDAAATAIWGTKGANGVLIIKTKRGTVGKTRFSFSSKFSAKFEPKSIPMLDGDEYRTILSESIWNSAAYNGYTQSLGLINLLYNTNSIGYNPAWTYFDEYTQNTDWLSEVRKNTSSWENNFSMSGGGEKATYRFSLGYLDEGGTTIGTGFTRLNSKLMVSYRFSNKLKFDIDFNYTQSDRDDNYYNIRQEAFRKMPNKSPYYIDDKTGQRTSQYFSWSEKNEIDSEISNPGKSDKARNYNPIALANEGKNNKIQRESRINVNAEYKILPELTYRGYVSLDIRNTKGRAFLPQIATGLPWSDEYANRSIDTSSDQLSINTENKLMFIKNWEERHSIISNLIFRTEETSNSSYGSETSGNASPSLSDPSMGNVVQKTASGESKRRTLSGTANINYTFLNRYVFNATATAEGSSAMGKSERWGIFPSAGVAWHLADESFMRDIKWLQELKLRFSVGQSGTPAKGTSVYLGTFTGSTSDNYMDMDAIKPSDIQLNHLKWETTTEYNTGMDISLLKGRLRFTVDVYQKFTKDLLQKDVKAPTTIGYGDYKINYYNSGKMTNKGWEFRTDVVAVENKDFRLAGFFNISRNINKLTELPSHYIEDNYTFDNGNYAFRYEEGRTLGAFYGYRYKGVYQNTEATYARDAEGNVMKNLEGKPIVMQNGTKVVYPGDAIYEDINHDGVINQYDIVYLGNSLPKFTLGAGLNLSYKQFKLTANFFGRYGMKVINEARMNNESMHNSDNQSKAVLRRWREEGQITDIPRALYKEGYNYLGSDRFVEDASFLRLKSLSLTYNVPKNLCQNWGLNNMNVYVTGYNLFTWTDYTGQDPEIKPSNTLTKDTAVTPCSIQFVCGVNLSF